MEGKVKFRFFSILSTVFFITCFILTQTVNTEIVNHLFWSSWLLITVCVIFDMTSWSKSGLNPDINKSPISRLFADSTTLLLIYYITLFLLIILFTNFNKEVVKNNYVIIGTFIMTLEFELFMYTLVYSSRRETITVLKKYKK